MLPGGDASEAGLRWPLLPWLPLRLPEPEELLYPLVLRTECWFLTWQEASAEAPLWRIGRSTQ
jgi:hypothetical protein